MRQWIGLVLFALALGTLRTVGCNDDPCGGCDDGDPCTRDWCDYVNTSGTISCNPEDYEYQCQHSRLPNGTACGGDNVCVNGDCTENLCVNCEDDGNSCTIDCDYETGACDYVAVRDGLSCEDDSREGECYEGVCVVCARLPCDDPRRVSRPCYWYVFCFPVSGNERVLGICQNPEDEWSDDWISCGTVPGCEGGTGAYPCPNYGLEPISHDYVCCPWAPEELRLYCVFEDDCDRWQP